MKYSKRFGLIESALVQSISTKSFPSLIFRQIKIVSIGESRIGIQNGKLTVTVTEFSMMRTRMKLASLLQTDRQEKSLLHSPDNIPMFYSNCDTLTRISVTTWEKSALWQVKTSTVISQRKTPMKHRSLPQM